MKDNDITDGMYRITDMVRAAVVVEKPSDVFIAYK